MSSRKFAVWLLLSFFYAYQFTLRVIPAVSVNELMVRFGLDAAQFGTFCSVYYIGYTAASIPLSIAIDRYNARMVIVLTVVMVCCGIACLMTDSWYLAIIGRIITGVGSTGAILGVLKVISIYFEPRQQSKMLGISVTIGLLGGIYGGKPLAILIEKIGFDATIALFVMIGSGIAVATYLLLPKKFPGNAGDDLTISTILSDIKKIFQNKALILLAIAGGLMVGPMEGFVDGWSVITLKSIHNWSDSDAALAPSTLFFGMCIGASVIGILIEKTQRYYTTIGICSILMMFGFSWILWGNSENMQFMFAVLFLIGVASAYQIVVMCKAGLLVSARLVTTGTAITNMIVMIFGSIYHAIIGNLITANNTLTDGLYSIDAIKSGIIPLIIGLGVAILLLPMVARLRRS